MYPYTIALTGNIATGKSSAIACFQSLGIEVISADIIARELTLKGQPALLAIKEHFGERALNNKGELDRAYLRDHIFAHPEARVWLENLLHPLIRKAIEARITTVRSVYVVIEIPLLKHREDYPYLDRVLVLLADFEQKIERVMARDHCDRHKALAILNTQADDQHLQSLADDLLVNNGSIQELSVEIKKLHTRYLHFAHKKSS